METDRPAEYSDWPVEVRELYDAIIRAAYASQKDALAMAMKHLSGFIRQREDQTLADAVCGALLELARRIIPEEAAALLFRDHGQWAMESRPKSCRPQPMTPHASKPRSYSK
jgi:hypothetical protein